MSAKLDIKTIEFRNFLSYGDYVTKLDISDCGPTLVCGDNGAGKTSFLTALIWCIFGRTVRHPSPGDRVVNWDVGSDCYVKVITNDGWTITRTRQIDNHNDLLIYKDGVDATKSTNKKAQAFLLEEFGLDYEIFTSSVFCGQFGKAFLEMAPIKRKEAIERLLGLDKINEYAKSAKEKCVEVESEQKGIRAAIDVLEANFNRQESRIQSMRDEILDWDSAWQNRISSHKSEIEELLPIIEAADPPDLEKLQAKWNLYENLQSSIRDYKKKIKLKTSQIVSKKADIEDLRDRIKNPQIFDIPNLDELEDAHELADQSEKLERQRAKKHTQLEARKTTLAKRILDIGSKIRNWETQQDSICSLCEQEIGSDHVHTQVDELKKESSRIQKEYEQVCSEIKICSEPILINRPSISLEQARQLHDANLKTLQDVTNAKSKAKQLKDEISEIEEASRKLRKTVDRAEAALGPARPKKSLREAREAVKAYEGLISRLSIAQQALKTARREQNPYKKVLKDLQTQLDDSKSEITEHNTTIAQLDLIYAHYWYIYRSYSDRRKIKSLILSELIPYLNDRIAHYLASFDIEMKIQFSSTLGNETDKWDYEFCSGGERKKIDLSIMFAIYDLYLSLYGQQCNLMVFDEVDSRLDAKGVQVFSDIITSYSSEQNPLRPGSIFVISHKPELKDLLPSQWTVKKQNGFSIIDQN